MKRRTIVILFLTHIALLVGGFYLGKFFSFRDAMRQANLIGSIGATGMFHEYLRVQLEQGSCSEAAEALLSYERMLDQFKGRDGALVSGGLSSFERVITYVRLAKLPGSRTTVSVLRNICRSPERLVTTVRGLTVLSNR